MDKIKKCHKIWSTLYNSTFKSHHSVLPTNMTNESAFVENIKILKYTNKDEEYYYLYISY